MCTNIIDDMLHEHTTVVSSWSEWVERCDKLVVKQGKAKMLLLYQCTTYLNKFTVCADCRNDACPTIHICNVFQLCNHLKCFSNVTEIAVLAMCNNNLFRISNGETSCYAKNEVL